MSQKPLRFRQIHLDFHTSPDIPDIGEAFSKERWQKTLKDAAVDSITCFSKCHHGLSYHPTQVGKTHPNLSFNLLRAQMDALKEVDINVPVYISAGVDDVAGSEHPEWREISHEGRYQGWKPSPLVPGFITMCFNTPYLNYLCQQIEEVVRMFPECDGIFLDIISQGECLCRWCMQKMQEEGLDPANPEHRRHNARRVLERYYQATTHAARILRPDMPVFHNSGHIARSNRQILRYFSHLEIESLPTSFWGYDHFPLSAKFAETTGLDYLGMTGKFHSSWGEFGGFKHPNALKYECAAMLALGARCSVGDQLHPSGALDPSTYSIIGQAYRQVREAEDLIRESKNVADIGLLSSESENGNAHPDTGAGRLLLEEGLLFDLIDRTADFTPYPLLILPDNIRVDSALQNRLNEYLQQGGSLLLTGESGLTPDGSGFALDIGADYLGTSPNQPDYLDLFNSPLAPDFVSSPLVMYLRSQMVAPTDAESLAGIRAPYFNRTWQHYCSHQHAPHGQLTPCSAALQKGTLIYLAHPIFTQYYAYGAVAYRQYAARAVRRLLGDRQTLATSLPSTARTHLRYNPQRNSYILSLLYADITSRGADLPTSPEGFVWPGRAIQIIEDLPRLTDIEVQLKLPRPVDSVRLQPQDEPLEFSQAPPGTVRFILPSLQCSQLVEISPA